MGSQISLTCSQLQSGLFISVSCGAFISLCTATLIYLELGEDGHIGSAASDKRRAGMRKIITAGCIVFKKEKRKNGKGGKTPQGPTVL